MTYTSASGFTGISLAGRWECGNCGASGDGWYDDEDGLRLDEDHECPEGA
ncbi:hypothetical protein [Streptomyces albidoflavus]